MRALSLLILLAAPALADDFEDGLAAARGQVRETLAQSAPSRMGRAPAAPAARTLPFNADVPQELRERMSADFGVLGRIHGARASQLHQDVFGPVRGRSYLDFFDGHVRHIGMAECGGAGAVACVKPLQSWDTMWLASGYTTFDMPLVYRLNVLLHESRHTETLRLFWSHDPCPERDFFGNPIIGIFSGLNFAGRPACDEKALGAYGVGLIFMMNVARHCDNCSGKMKMDAELYGADTLKRITDRPSYDRLHADLFR